MQDLSIRPSGVWDQAFDWNAHALHAHILIVTPTYDNKHPRTWPLIKAISCTDQAGNTVDDRKSVIPPILLAYDQSLMGELVKHAPMKRIENSRQSYPVRKRVHLVFRYYPFNFDSHGRQRNYPHIPPADIGLWKEIWSGTDSPTYAIPEGSRPTVPQDPDEITPVKAITPTPVYHEIKVTLPRGKGTSSIVLAGRDKYTAQSTQLQENEIKHKWRKKWLERMKSGLAG